MANTRKQKVIAVAAIRNAEGLLLVQKRIDPLIPEADGKWEFPGGVVEFGETPEQAAIRECKEEVGCDIEIIRLLPLAYTKTWNRTDNVTLQVFVWCFEARHISGDPKPLDKKVSEIKWVTKKEIPNLDCLPGVKAILGYIE